MSTKVIEPEQNLVKTNKPSGVETSSVFDIDIDSNIDTSSDPFEFIHNYIMGKKIVSTAEYCIDYFRCVPATMGKVTAFTISKRICSNGYYVVRDPRLKVLVKDGFKPSKNDIKEYYNKVTKKQLHTFGITVDEKREYSEWMSDDDKLNHSYLERFFLLLMEEKPLQISEAFPGHPKIHWVRKVIKYMIDNGLIVRKGRVKYEYSYSLVPENQDHLTTELIDTIVESFPFNIRKKDDEYDDLEDLDIEPIEQFDESTSAHKGPSLEQRVSSLESHVIEINYILANYKAKIIELAGRIRDLEDLNPVE